MARNPAQRASARIMKGTEATLARLYEIARRLVRQGVPPDKAIERAAKQVNLAKSLKDAVTKEVSSILSDTKSPAVRKFWLNNVWTGERVSLSTRINDMARLDEIKGEVRASMKRADSWTQIAENLKEQGFQKGDTPKHLDELTKAARSALRGDPAAVAEYRAAIRKSISQVERLAQSGAPTQRLKAAYEDVITATREGSEAAIDRAMEQAISEKGRYNAERIARTETARAYGQQVYADVDDDEQVVAIGYDLSEGHPRTDICDFITSADLFGLGKGVYPLKNLPPYPFHPSCLCDMYNVYEGEASGKLNNAAAKKYLKDAGAEKRRILLGVDGAAAFARDPDSWAGNLKNFEGTKPIEDLREVP